MLAVGVGAFVLGPGNNDDKGGLITPTPIVTVTTSSIPPTTIPVTPTLTSTPLPTVTATPTPIPTVGYVTKKIKVDIENASPAKAEYTIEVPSTTTVSVGKNEIFLRNGSKTYMWLHSTNEYFKATYTSKKAITSSTISNLFRVTTKQDLGNSFYVAYATSDTFLSNASCADPAFGVVAAPCLTPFVTVPNGGFRAKCSVQSQYIPICDRIMKTISVKNNVL